MTKVTQFDWSFVYENSFRKNPLSVQVRAWNRALQILTIYTDIG